MDLNDTLEDDRVIPGAIRRTCELVATRFPTLDLSQLVEVNERIWAEYWPQVEKECWLGSIDAANVSREAWRRTIHACGSDNASIVEFAFERAQNLDREARRRFPDVADLLSCVQALDLRLALVTNGPSELQRDRLRSLRLSDAFDAVVISAEIGVAKPDPAPFLLATEQLDISTSEAWHVGDSLDSDISGARAAGLTAVWLNRAGFARRPADPRPDIEVPSLVELAALLRAAEPIAQTPSGLP
jgi:HAD superfamily hydrolase (TIGR01549 family)